MEGITDPIYRSVVMKLYPEWDQFFTDFLRVPSSGFYSQKKIIEHFGKEIFENEALKKKTTFQILCSINSNIEHTIKQIKELGIEYLDLNLGCPSRKVNSHGGGSYLLSDLKQLQQIISEIRKNFDACFTVKMRVGFRNDELFEESLKLLENEGVNAVTLHARTRDQLYKGIANWDYIQKAKKTLTIPLIGNGDVWNVEDIQKMYGQTNCHSIMVARGALKTPWLATNLKKNISDSLQNRKEMLIQYFHALELGYRSSYNWEDAQVLRRFKALSRYLFDDFDSSLTLKSAFLREKSLENFIERLQSL